MRTVSPKLKQWLEDYNQLAKKLIKNGFKPTPINAREGLATLTQIYVTDKPDMSWVQDDYIISPHRAIPVRIYHPDKEKALPVLIYFHGGGHMAGSVSVYDPICRKIANAARHIIVAVDYRLAPECPYPAGVHDACHAAKYVWPTLDQRGLQYKRSLSIAGDSGGGALSATVAQTAQHDAGISIRRQVLIYPSLDYTMTAPSMSENATGYLLERDKILWYFDNYLQHAENRRDASPLHMDFTEKLPETLIFTVEFCPLRDDGLAYYEKLKAAGVKAEHVHFDNMIHAFLNLEGLVRDECDSVYRKIGEFLNRR